MQTRSVEPVRVALRAAACSPLAFALAGCDSLQGARGADSILVAFSPTSTPQDAAELALDRFNPDNRFRGINLLADADFGGAEVYLRLYEDAIEDEDAGVRQAGVRALGLHGVPEHAQLIAQRLTDPVDGVRVAAARALQRLHNTDATPALMVAISTANETNPDVRAEAAHALGQYRQFPVLDALISALDDPSLLVNKATLEALETLTGQNFGLDRVAWTDWLEEAERPFLAGRVYAYPGFKRDRRLLEYLPFVPGPPNEPAGAPIGLPRDGG